MTPDMRQLYASEKAYYISRTPSQRVDYEESYWHIVRDPDGCVRDRLKERQQHVADLKAEIEYIQRQPSGRIMDVGCGLGFLLSALSDEWEKYGVEISRFAAKQAGRWGKIFCGQLEDGAYPDGYFDVVVLHHVIEHVEKPEDLVVEVRRILKGDGKLVLGTPDFDSGAARLFGKNYRMLCDDTHISLFSSDSMHRFLRDYGFHIERVDYPFFETRHFTKANLLRMFDNTCISPPFYGNFMTFYAYKGEK
ncbi:MAG: class I SAM-dependent methyltransferase [Bacteroidia bacterium]|nr:class I SAM-dependent methyltransferase [Bacteroidia bacterium]